MTMPTALAPTVELATPKVQRFAEKIRSYLGGVTERFYTCDPADNRVEDCEGNKWIEGSWGLHIITDGFSTEYLLDLQYDSDTVRIDNATIRPRDNGHIELILWLTARVMR